MQLLKMNWLSVMASKGFGYGAAETTNRVAFRAKFSFYPLFTEVRGLSGPPGHPFEQRVIINLFEPGFLTAESLDDDASVRV
jgi:hypothetical protein